MVHFKEFVSRSMVGWQESTWEPRGGIVSNCKKDWRGLYPREYSNFRTFKSWFRSFREKRIDIFHTNRHWSNKQCLFTYKELYLIVLYKELIKQCLFITFNYLCLSRYIVQNIIIQIYRKLRAQTFSASPETSQNS